MLSIVIHCYPLLSIVVNCCSLLSIVIHCCSLLSIVIHTLDRSKEEGQDIDKRKQIPCLVRPSAKARAEPGDQIVINVFVISSLGGISVVMAWWHNCLVWWQFLYNSLVASRRRDDNCDIIGTSKKRWHEKLLVIRLSQPQEPASHCDRETKKNHNIQCHT